MEEYLPLIIQLVSGAVGGNVAGKILKKRSLGTLWNSIAGILGGGLGGWILGMASLSLPSVLGSIAAGGVGGGVIMAIIGVLRKDVLKKRPAN